MWSDIGNVCGSGFLSSITAQAGGNIASGAGKNAAVSMVAVGAGAAMLAILAL